jgi:hypothetical protein
VTGHFAGALVADIGLLRTAAGIHEVEAHRRAFAVCDFPAAVIGTRGQSFAP